MLNHNQELIQDIIAQLKASAKDALIVVEGKKDRRALRRIGIDSKIFLLNSRKSLVELSECVSKQSSRVILMLDSDAKGKELTRKMKSHFQAQGVKVDMVGRRLLCAARTCTVEGLGRILK